MTERRILMVLGLIGMVGASYVAYRSLQPSKSDEPAGIQVPADTTATPYANCLRVANQDNRLILLVFSQKACEPCHRWKRNILPDPRVHKSLSNYIYLEVDTTQNDELCKKFNIDAVPNFVVINGSEAVKKQHAGYMNVMEFVAWLDGTVIIEKRRR